MSGLIRFFVRDFLGNHANAIAAGRRGAGAKDWYWRIAGRKRLIGFSLMLLAYAVAAGNDSYCSTEAVTAHAIALCAAIARASEWLQVGAGILIAIGFVDKDWRNPAQGVPDALAGLAAHAATIGAVLFFVVQGLGQLSAPWAAQAVQLLEDVIIPTLLLGGLVQAPARVLRGPAGS